MDEADRAQPFEEMQIDAALRAAGVGRPKGAGSPTCTQCGDEIPQGRRDAERGCYLCVDCQDRLERGMGR